MFELGDDDTATNFGPLIISEGGEVNDLEFEIKNASRRAISVSSTVERIRVADPKLERRFSPESGMWNIGDVILGIYEVVSISDNEPFSEGGAGVVNRIYHREWDMELAVKSPKPHVFQSESGKLNYEKEAQTWIELGLHPNIVTCYLVRRISDIPRLFAEFVKDGSLRQWILDGRLYSGGSSAALLRIIDIAIQSAWGIEHAHSQKLLHLDVKPANIMMSGQIAKVTDFGLAQGISEIAKSSSADLDSVKSYSVIAGGMTPGFCSPEQYISFERAKNNDFDNLPKITLQSDIWSWAISVLAMFHGRTPCKRGGQTARKVLEVFLRDNKPDSQPQQNETTIQNVSVPAIERPLMPDKVAELLFHCFEENPLDRPCSMGEVAERLIKIYGELSGTTFARTKPRSTTWTPETINNRAASMLDLEKPAEAKQLLDQAATLQPWHPEVTYNQTILAWRSAQITDLQAIERLETLTKMRNTDANAIYAEALAQRERGNLKTALEEAGKAIELESREEYRRMFISIERFLPRAARCVERIQVARGFEGKICVDSRGEFILIEKPATDLNDRVDGGEIGQTDKIYEIIKVSTGQIQHKFSQQVEDHIVGRVGVSDDLLWELVKFSGSGGELDSVILRRIGAKTGEAKFRLINWSQKLSSLPESETIAGKIYIGKIHGDRVTVLRNKDDKEIGNLIGHEGAVTALVFSEDGKFAFTGGADRTLRLWELPVMRCLRTFTSVGGAAVAVYFDDSGKFALSLAAGGLVRIWDTSILCSGNKFHAPLLLSHVTSSEEAGRRQTEMNQFYDNIKESVKKLDYSSAIKFVSEASVLSGWETMRMRLGSEGVWDNFAKHTQRRSLSATICSSIFKGHDDTISTVVISADGKLAASAGKDMIIRVWDIQGHRIINELAGHSDWVRSIGLTRDGRFLLSGSWDGTVRVWNIVSGKCVRVTDEKIKSIAKIAVNPQGRTVAIATAQGRVIFWDVLTSSVRGAIVAGTGGINTVKYSCNGEFLLTGSDDGNVSLWKVGKDTPEQVIHVHKSAVTDAAISPDLRRIVSADRDGQVVFCNLNGEQTGEIRGHLNEITGLVFLADNRFVMSCSKDAKVRISFVGGGEIFSSEVEHLVPVYSMSVDLCGNYFVTGGEDGLVRVWSMYWDYEFNGWSEVTPEAENMLRVLLFPYKNANKKNEPTPQTKIAAITKRLTQEMQYHGFGFIETKKLEEKISKLYD
jgi:WD40 repeat protein/serine/threonine protein kinase